MKKPNKRTTDNSGAAPPRCLIADVGKTNPMRWYLLLLLTALPTYADDGCYLETMIKCDEKDEQFVEGAFDAFNQLSAGGDVKKDELRLPARLTKEAQGVVSFERAFYLTPNIFRGFELVVPVDCLRQKDGCWISTVTLTVTKQESRQGVTTLTLKKKEPSS